MAGYQYVYVMNGLSKTYPGGKTVLNNLTLSFFPGAKIGVLGPNGAGKSTLLKIMAGVDKEFVGEAWADKNARVGYLPQEPQLDESKNVLENVMEACRPMLDKIARFNAIGLEMCEEGADFDKLTEEMGALQDDIDHGNG